MKLKKLVLLSSLMIGLVPFSRGQGTIVGTAHDFSFKHPDYDPSMEICIVCHAPHNTSTVAGETPLWNHLTTTTTFTPYGTSGSSGYNIHFTPGSPDGASKLCLSCHDGITAINAYGTGAGNPLQDTAAVPRTKLIYSGFAIGPNLSKTHPISFVYDGALVSSDPGLYDTSHTTPLGHSIGVDMLDKQGKVQCTSCHEPHSNTYYRFQRMSNAGSALCLTCHKK